MSLGGGGLQNQHEHHTILTKNEVVHLTAFQKIIRQKVHLYSFFYVSSDLLTV